MSGGNVFVQFTQQVVEFATIRVAFDLLFPLIEIGGSFRSDPRPKLFAWLKREAFDFFENFSTVTPTLELCAQSELKASSLLIRLEINAASPQTNIEQGTT